MTERMCHELREIAEVRVARDGHVGVVNLECLAWMTDLSFYTIRDSDKPQRCRAYPILDSARSTNTKSDITFDQIKEWMQRCRTHPHCLNEGDPVLPTRVLDIGDSVEQDLKLVETHGRSGQYIALSHCWGTSSLIKTTLATIAERKKGIPFSQLPKTFQEATSILHRLGFRYLWIDSFCIIQDDEADWQRESAQMAGIYSKAALTVAVSASQDARGGCFKYTPELSGFKSWEIAVEYAAPNGDPAESLPQEQSNGTDRKSEDIRWFDDDEMVDHWEQWNSGGQARSIFSSTGEQLPVMRYLPGHAPPVSLSGLSDNKPDTIQIAQTLEDRDINTKRQPCKAQKPPNFLGKLDSLEHSTGVYVRELLTHEAFASNRAQPRSLEIENPLGGRAWALQERLLSTRILHFTASEVVWECRSDGYCQCGLVGCDGPWGIGAIGSDRSPTKSLKLTFDHALREATSGKPEQIKDMWTDLVYIYTAKSMTYTTDRLPAASGLIKRLQQANTGECFAGMWRKYLLEQMTWEPHSTEKKNPRQERYVAPTWSWASVRGHVYFMEPLDSSELVPALTVPAPNVVAEVINVQYELAGLDATGSLSDAVLTMRGPVLPAYLFSRRRPNTKPHESNGVDEFEFYIVHPRLNQRVPFEPDSTSDIDTSIERQDVLCVQWTKNVDLEPLLAERRALEAEGAYFTLRGTFLVIRETTKRLGKYERVGLRTFYSRHNKPDYQPEAKIPLIDKWFERASVRTLDLV